LGEAVPAVTVVVPTYHRDRELGRLLDLLASQEYPREQFEIVVVDDALSKSAPAVVDAAAARHPDVAMRCLPGGGKGPATARNIGWRAARGAVIAFIDDDAYPQNGRWLREGLARFEDASVQGVAGRVSVPRPDGRPTDFQRNVAQLESGTFLTCNAFFRRAALERVGGFDERFRVPYREDSDLYYRLEAAGGAYVQADDAVVVHPAPEGAFAVSLRLQRYSLFNALLFKKHPARYRREIVPGTPYHYYAMLLSLLGAVLALARGRSGLARLLLGTWALLEMRFFLRRASGTSRRPRHLLDLAYTSLLIPPLSIYWRLRGAWRFRVLFF
jgi:glycosyltransferase involved in cell wall biosynthesis